MSKRIKLLALGAGAALAVIGAAGAQTSAGGPIHVPSKDVEAMVAKPVKGLASAQIPAGPGVVVMIARRDGDGEVEVHKALADEMMVREGHARIRVGGAVTGQRQSAPGEFRGGTLAGGAVYDMSAGDVLFIPVGAPHQMLVKAGEHIVYLTAKFPG